MAKDPEIDPRTDRVKEIIEQLENGDKSRDEAQDLLEEGREQLTEVQDILTRGSGDIIELSE